MRYPVWQCCSLSCTVFAGCMGVQNNLKLLSCITQLSTIVSILLRASNRDDFLSEINMQSVGEHLFFIGIVPH